MFSTDHNSHFKRSKKGSKVKKKHGVFRPRTKYPMSAYFTPHYKHYKHGVFRTPSLSPSLPHSLPPSFLGWSKTVTHLGCMCVSVYISLFDTHSHTSTHTYTHKHTFFPIAVCISKRKKERIKNTSGRLHYTLTHTINIYEFQFEYYPIIADFFYFQWF